MMNRFGLVLLSLPVLASFAACSSSSSNTTAGADGGGDPDGGGGADAGSDVTSGGTQCSKARDDLLIPIDKVATGMVGVVSDTGGVKTIYVDATAGGLGNSVKNPRIYVDLGAGTKVSVTDKSAPESNEWDLALKRSVIFTNSGDAGIGVGGGIQLNKSFASVSASEAEAATLEKERFFDENCEPQLDQIGGPNTTFADWYDYDQATMIPTPKNVTYVVRGGTGKKYKVGIKYYDGKPDGTSGGSTGFFVLQVSAL